MGFDYVVCDSPAGIEHGAVIGADLRRRGADRHQPRSCRCATPDRILGIIQAKSRRAINGEGTGEGAPPDHPLLAEARRGRRVCFPTRIFDEILRVKIIGVVPQSESVLQSSNQGTPAIHLKESDVAEAYLDIVDRFLGTDKPSALRRLRKARPLQATVRR